MAKRRLKFSGPSEGARLLAIVMREQGLTKTALANRCGVSDSAICRWLSGVRSPDVHSLAMIENVTGIAARTWALPPMVDDRPSRTGTDG